MLFTIRPKQASQGITNLNPTVDRVSYKSYYPIQIDRTGTPNILLVHIVDTTVDYERCWNFENL